MPRRLLLLGLVLVASSGCEVSVFGSEPVQLFGGAGPASGGESGACGEPEETRRVRERLADGEPTSGESSPCAYHCVLENGTLTDESRATCPLATVGDDGVLHLDMGRADAFVARIEVCDDTVLQLADSIGARSDGADDPATAHDASVVLRDATLDLFPAHDGGLSPSHVDHFGPASDADAGASEERCALRTIELTDSVVYLYDVERGLCGSSMLRIDPPTDAQGPPDSLWHLSAGRTLDGAHTGAPPPRVDLCFL